MKAQAMTAEVIAETLLAARQKLVRPQARPVSGARALGAAALAAVSGLTLAGAVILGPGHDAKDAAPPTMFSDR
jgi:hypothetical protein